MNHTETVLEFDKIKEMLCAQAVSEAARRELTGLAPYLSRRECRDRLNETTQARTILDACGSPPLSPMRDLEQIIDLCEKDGMLSAEQLEYLATFITSCRRLKNYLKKAEETQDGVARYGQSIRDLTELKEEIDLAIRDGRVTSSASTALRDVRRNGSVSMRNGRYVLPVRKEFSILFESVENRKARRQMERKFVPGLTIQIEEP